MHGDFHHTEIKVSYYQIKASTMLAPFHLLLQRKDLGLAQFFEKQHLWHLWQQSMIF
jgi:hypothetical protein